jgi:hypothetical protein
MTRIKDINNRIDGHMILCDGEITTDGLTLGFDEHINMNPSKFKRLGMRKIKSELSENPGYPFGLDITCYDRSTGGNYMYFLRFRLNLTTQKPMDIAAEIVEKLQAYLALRNKTQIVGTMNYDSSIYIYWSNAGNSNDFFELSLVNDYKISHFSFEMGANSDNLNSRQITKNNPYLFIRNYANVNGVYDSYNPMPNYDINNLYFHWDVMESYN